MGGKNRRRSGVTLAEALIMILVAGSLMVPIIGTLQQGVIRTSSLELHAAMQNYAESALAEITYKAIYQGVRPEASVVTVNYPNDSEPEYQIIIKVEVVAGSEVSDDNSILVGPIHGDLCAVAVVVALVNSGLDGSPDIEPISLMSMFCPPPPPPDYIYTAHPSTSRIGIINPMNHQLITEVPVASPPLQLAVHPNGRYVAIKGQHNIRMLNVVDNTSHTIYNAANICGSTIAETGEGNNNVRNDRGIAFRSDGKFLYFTRHSPQGLVTLSAPPDPMDPWTLVSFIPMNSTNANDLKMLDDGTLIVAEGGAAPTNRVFRVNTHTNTAMHSYAAGADGASSLHLAYAGEWGGNQIYARLGTSRLTSFLSHAPTSFLTGTYGGSLPVGDTQQHSILVGYDNNWIIQAHAKSSPGASDKLLTSVRLPISSSNLTTTTSSRVILRGPPSGLGDNAITQLEYSPFREEIICKTTDADFKLLFPSIAALTTGTAYANMNSISSRLPLNSACADVKGRIAEYAWVACENGADYKLDCFDIYGGADGKGVVLSDFAVSPPDRPRGLALNASGIHGSCSITQVGVPPKRLNVSDYSSGNFPNALSFPALATAGKMAYLLDGSLLVGLEKSSCNCFETGAYYPGELGWNDIHNGFLLYEADNNGNPKSLPALGLYAKSDANQFLIRDIATLHRRSGAYVLLSKTDDSDAMLVWVEKSRAPGYTPQLATESYRIMGYWRTLFDGFPTRAAKRMALSADDSMLAIYDCVGNGTKQAVHFYDLNNNRFPTTAGLAYNRYKDGSFGSPLNAAVSNAYYDNQLNSNWSTVAVQKLKPGNILTASTSLDADLSPTGNYESKFPVDFNWDVGSNDDIFYSLSGYFYHDFNANFVGFKSHDAARFSKGGYYPHRNASTRQPWYDDSSTDNYVSYDYIAGNGSGTVQFDMFSDDANLGANFAHSTVAGNFSSGSWGSTKKFAAKMFRPFKFKPPLIKTMLFNGVSGASSYSLPDMNSAASTQILMCFSRDAAIPALFVLDKIANKLFAFNVFEEQLSIHNGATQKFVIDLTSMGFTFNDMAISPDGRRLMICGQDGSAGVLAAMDIAYNTGNPGRIDVTAGMAVGDFYQLFKKMSLDLPALYLATRPFNGFTSRHDSYPATTVGGVSMAVGYGSHRTAVAKDGIYVFGGTAGIEADANNDRIYRIKSDANVDLLAATMTNKLKDFAAVPFDDDKILLFGGEAYTTEKAPQYSVSVYDALTGSFTQDAHAAMASDSNEVNKLRRHAAAATPFGPVIVGGIQGDENTGFIEMDFASSWNNHYLSTPNTDASLSGDPVLKISDGSLAPKHGSYFLNHAFPITGNTSFISSFTTIMFKKDGITFCVHNDSRGVSALGSNDNDLGYSGGGAINPSLALWMEAKVDAVDIGINGAKPSLSGAGYVNFQTDFYSGSLGSAADERTTCWWVVYDGLNNKLNVWVENEQSGGTLPTGNPEKATWIIKDYTYDMTSLGTQAYFGFTGATNDGSGYHKVKNWHLKIWEKSATPVTHFADTSFPSVPSYLTIKGPDLPSISSNMIRLTSSSSGKAGAVWFNSSFDSNTLESFSTEFCLNFWDSGTLGAALVIQGHGSTKLAETTTSGLGYGNMSNSMVVEFDTGNSGAYDPNANHIWITKNGDFDASHSKYYTPTNTMNDLSSRRNWFWVEYHSPANNLRVYCAQNTSSTQPSKPSVPVLNHIFSGSLSSIVGPNAWIGFTAKTGTTGQEHNLAMWKLWSSNLNATVGGITKEVKTYLPNTISGSLADVSSQLSFVSDATSVGNSIRLVDNAMDNKGAVWTKNSVPITNNSKFSTHFVMRFAEFSDFAASPKQLCDGVAFVVHGGADNVIGEQAYFIGYGGGGSTIGGNFGVECDVINNSGQLSFTENNGNHLAAFKNGDAENERLPRAIDPNGTNMVDDKETHIWIDYDGPTRTIRGYASKTHIKPSSPALTYQYIAGETFSTIIGGSNARFGLTSANGLWNSEAWIEAWELVVDNKMVIQFPPRGETLATTDLPAPLLNGAAVTHYSRKDGKYYLYYIGAGPAMNDQSNALVHRFDFDSGTWTAIELYHGTNKFDINFAIPAGASQNNKGTQVAACSWGEEIFIFGGSYHNAGFHTERQDAIAFNPDTNRFRQLAPINSTNGPGVVVSPAAVPYGPFIFLIGGSTSYDGLTGTVNTIKRYKP